MWIDHQEVLGPDNAIWDDGEWVSWAEIDQQIEFKEWQAKYPNGKRSLVPTFNSLMHAAESYFDCTRHHLSVYGEIGELFCAITLGVKLHKQYAQGSDGRLGNDFIEIKTITPFKKQDTVSANLAGNFNKLAVVKINEDFEVSLRLIDRKDFPRNSGKTIRINWDNLPE